jgi:hypothetical protein
VLNVDVVNSLSDSNMISPYVFLWEYTDMVALSHQAKKCPDEPGETGMMESAVLGWVSQGLQHEVIAMASCCKKGGGQKGNNCHRQTCTGTTGITALRRDWVVVAGIEPASIGALPIGLRAFCG